MGASTGDIIRITDIQTYNTSECLNVYFYQVNLTTGLDDTYLAVLGDWFTTNVVSKVKVIQASSAIIHTGLFLENLTNGVDILSYTTGYPIGGTEESDAQPPFVTYSFELLRETRSTRNGRKGIAGVAETLVDDGVYIGSATPINDIETAMSEDVVLGIAHVFNPVIVKHPIVVPLVSPVVNPIGGALFKSIGSQNTRKFGRGI